MNMLVATMFNPKQGFNVFVSLISRHEYKIKHQLGRNSYSTEFFDNKCELAKNTICIIH